MPTPIFPSNVFVPLDYVRRGAYSGPYYWFPVRTVYPSGKAFVTTLQHHTAEQGAAANP